MTAQEFADKYFGPNATAQPFRSDLTVNWKGDPATLPADHAPATSTGINPAYCATEECAHDLGQISGRTVAGTVKLPPFPGWPQANQYTQSDTVPYLQFTGMNVRGETVVVNENAGQLAAFFSHGYPAAFALQAIQQQIDMDLHAALPPQPE